MKDPEYEIKPYDEGDEEFIEKKCEEYEFSIVPPVEGAKEEKTVLKITDEEGKLIGGCVMVIYPWKIAFLNLLWVDEQYRRQGLGSALIHEYERIAREKDCYISLIYTFDFQAKPLYEKHGYTVSGIRENWPQGHREYALVKRLDRSYQEYVPSKVMDENRFEIRIGDKEDAELISHGLEKYVKSFVTSVCEEKELYKKITDKEGRIIAGCTNNVDDWGACFIELWVDEKYRNQGIGSFLLHNAEHEARENGAYIMLIWVFDWRMEFFRKNGFTAWMTVEDCPKGHRYYAMMKEL